MDPKASMALSHRESDRPRRILTRAGLHPARDPDSELKTLQLSAGTSDSAEAYAPGKARALSAPPNVAWSCD